MSTVTIDPGHGGTGNVGGSSGNNATGPNGTMEKTLTLDIGLKCRDILARQGHTVSMTRTTDVNLSLIDRAHVARDRRADAFVSLHFNAPLSPDPSTQGTETHVYIGTDVGTGSYRLAQLVQENVLAATGHRDRGVRRTDLGVINPAHHYESTAACLVEISFLTNPDEETRLADEDYRFQLAEAIAVGVHDYVTRRYALFEHRRLLRKQTPKDCEGVKQLRSVQELAQRVQRHAAITLATSHASGNDDDAMAEDNINDAAAGRNANRSSYTDGANTGPGGTVALDEEMLEGMLTLADEYNFTVSEIAGGVHGTNSRHYAGVAFDINRLNGAAVNAGHPNQQAFRDRGAALGATEVLGPGNAGHGTHIHLAWPRNLVNDDQKEDDSHTCCEGGDHAKK